MNTLLSGLMIGLVVMLGGCSQNQWAKDGATENDFVNDRYACHQMVLARYGALGLQLLNKYGDIEQCLRDHGYRDFSITQMANDPRAHLTPEEITRFGAEINTPGGAR